MPEELSATAAVPQQFRNSVEVRFKRAGSGTSWRLMERGKGEKGRLRELFDRGRDGFSGKGRTTPATAAAICQGGSSARADPSSHGPRASCAYHGARASAPKL